MAPTREAPGERSRRPLAALVPSSAWRLLGVLLSVAEGCESPAPTNLGETCIHSGAPVIHRDTTRSAARITTSTQNPGTDPNFDTVHDALDACGPLRFGSGVRRLGCADDSGATTLRLASTVTLPSVPAVTTRFISISGFARITLAIVPRGPYVLTVAEAPPRWIRRRV